jgi:hypothetical protein
MPRGRAGAPSGVAPDAPEGLRRAATAGLERGAFGLGPLDREFPRRAGRVEPAIEAPAVPALIVLEELRLDAVGAVIAQLAAVAAVTDDELEQRLTRPRGSSRMVVEASRPS